MLTPNDIANKKFDRNFGYGYRIDDVQDYLEEIAAEHQQLLDDKRDLEKKLEILADKLEEYRQDEDSLRAALLGAQKLGDSVIRESKTKAEIVMRDATIKAETMVDNARRQIEEEQLALAKMQKEVANFKNRLLALYRQHLELIKALPGDEPPQPKPPKREEMPDEEPRPEPVQEKTPEAEPAMEAVRDLQRPRAEQPAPEEELEAFEDTLDEDVEEIEASVQRRGPQGEEPDGAPPRPQQESRFGPLKFGDSFGLTREEEAPARTLSRKKW